MESLRNINTVGVGAGSRDYFLPVFKYGEKLPAYMGGIAFMAGGKVDLPSQDSEVLAYARSDSAVVKEVGGNVVNPMAAFAAFYGANTMSVAMGLGITDPASPAITERLHDIGVAQTAQLSDGYLPSESVIVRKRASDGTIMDRMVLGRPRSPLTELLRKDYLEERLSAAELVVAASIKDMKVNKLVSDMSSRAFLAWNFGSSEVRNYPGDILHMLEQRPADMLALNAQEAMELFGTTNCRPEHLMTKAMFYAKASVITYGKEGLWLARRVGASSRVYKFHHQPSEPVAPELVIDTLGAGDAVNAPAIVGMMTGASLKDIGEQCAYAGAQAVQYVGAHTYALQALRDRERIS